MGLSTALLARDGRTILVVLGPLDCAAAEQLRETIDRLVHTARGRIEVDLSRVDYLDPAAIEILVAGRYQADQLAKAYQVTGARDAVHYVLNVAGVLDYLTREAATAPHDRPRAEPPEPDRSTR